MSKINLVEAVNAGLKQEMSRDETVVVLGEDVGTDGGVFRASQGLMKEFGETRVIDTPLSESGIIGTSIGLAIAGLKPVAEVQFMGFLYPGYDQLISHASRLRTRSRGRFTCPIVVRMPYGGGIRAPEHHSESMEALLVHTPGLKVVIPSNPYDTKGLLASSIRDPDPVIFLEPKRIYRSHKQEVPDEEVVVPLGQAKIVQEGEQLTVISYGSMFPIAKNAAEQLLEEEKIKVELIDLRTVSPLDTKTIIESVKKTGKAVIVHEAPRTCGLAAEIIAEINEKAFDYLEAPIGRVTGYDTIFPLYQLENYYLPNEKKIIAQIKEALNY